MNKIRVLFTIPNFKTAGSQYVLLSLFRGIDRDAFEPFVCVEHHSDRIPEEIPIENRLIFQWTGSKGRDILGFKSILKKHNIDLLHSWDYKSNYLEPLATRLAGIKYLYTKKNNAWSKRWFLKSWISHHIAYDNPEMASRFFNGLLFRNKISFVPHGVDTKIFKPLPAIPHHSFNLVCIGNIGANKNQLFLLKALTKLPQQVVLHLYGREEAEYKKELEDYIEEQNLQSRAYFHGFVAHTDIPEVLKNMDLFVLPSINEGLPVSILEAMACGVPVLSSDSGGGSRYILEDRFIFKPDDVHGLVGKIKLIQTLSAQEKEEIRQKHLNWVRERFTEEAEMIAYQALYLSLLKLD